MLKLTLCRRLTCITLPLFLLQFVTTLTFLKASFSADLVNA